ncbi:hypothetical protein [Amycolatopsis sp. NPDC059657]|uniref:hypothetical protein n=1 Tax=Amycolatopsis sp. NPDC059657 TaxID=3346899 RepID=UPI003671B327
MTVSWKEWILAACSALGLVCGPSAQAPAPADSAAQARLGAELTLRIGESVAVQGADLRVGFDSVADSRCPPKVLCVWEGDAAVTVSLVRPSTGARTTVELHSNAGFAKPTIYEGFRVALTSVAQPADHVTLVVTKS